MSKKELYEAFIAETEEVLEASKMANKDKEALRAIFDRYLKPGASRSTNPPKLDDDGNIVEAYCRHHQRYEPAENMVISGGKSKGYCKASISKWTKAQKEIRGLEKEAITATLNDDGDKAKELIKASKELQELANSPEYYDYEADWGVFNGTKVQSES